MNENSLKNLKPATKGEVRNPHGRAGGLSKELQAIHEIRREELKRRISKVLRMSVKELEIFLLKQDVMACEAAIASILNRAIDKGDFMAFDMLISRLIGRMAPSKITEDMPKDEQVQVTAENVERLYEIARMA